MAAGTVERGAGPVGRPLPDGAQQVIDKLPPKYVPGPGDPLRLPMAPPATPVLF